MFSSEILGKWMVETRERTLDLVADLTDDQLMGPQLDIVNPMLWEIGHMAWFHEKWVLRRAGGMEPVHENVDALYDSIAIAHDTRWDLPLYSREETLAYMHEVERRVLERIEKGETSEEDCFHILYGVLHEDMHTEAFTYTRQTLGHSPPRIGIVPEKGAAGAGGGPLPGDVEIPGGTFMLGGLKDESFVFDNEKWAHPIELKPFAIARAAVTQAEYAAFADDGGFGREELWSAEGWSWRNEAGAEGPVYWKRGGEGWLRRNFDEWVPLEPHRPAVHVNWHEAEAYCRWAGRRLPSEAEWELAASCEPAPGGGFSSRKRRYPWGDDPPAPERANLDWQGMGCAEVGAYPEGDSAFGCRQMLGNVWEWTSSVFRPFPGFVLDPYKEYSEPWFETRKVLRGGGWATRSRLARNGYRNYFTPDRRDVWAGFRTCALDSD